MKLPNFSKLKLKCPHCGHSNRYFIDEDKPKSERQYVCKKCKKKLFSEQPPENTPVTNEESVPKNYSELPLEPSPESKTQ